MLKRVFLKNYWLRVFPSAFFILLNCSSSYAVDNWRISANEIPQSISLWGIDPSFFELKCLEGECSVEKKMTVIKEIGVALEKVPKFLRGTKISMLNWTELASGSAPQGHAVKEWDSIQFATPIDADTFERVLVHEIAHLWDETDHGIVSNFLKIRYYTQPYKAALSELWEHIRSINVDKSVRVRDQKLTEILVENKMLRRSDSDIHASDVYEYWGISVELYYHYRKLGRLSELETVLSKPEIDFLSKLNWD